MSNLVTAAATLLLLWAASGALAATIYHCVRARVLRLHPAQSSALLLAWGCAPAGIAFALTMLLFDAPAIPLVPAHCHTGACDPHAPLLAAGPLARDVAAALAVLLLLRLAAAGLRLQRGARLGRKLAAVSRADAGYRILEQPSAVAFTAGWLRPVVFLSEGLIAQSSAIDIAAILAHERAHRERRDNLRILLARCTAAPLPGFAASLLFRDLRLLTEQACDECAALRCGRLEVAEALLRISRAQCDDVPAGAQAFAGSGTELRIESLLGDCRRPLSRGRLVRLCAALALALALTVAPLHHLLELLH